MNGIFFGKKKIIIILHIKSIFLLKNKAVNTKSLKYIFFISIVSKIYNKKVQ